MEFDVEQYGKREDFPFEIVNFPHLEGNIPMRIGRNVLTSPTIRIARACQRYQTFVTRTRELIEKLENQHLPRNVTKMVLQKLVANKEKIPYKTRPRSILNDLLA